MFHSFNLNKVIFGISINLNKICGVFQSFLAVADCLMTHCLSHIQKEDGDVKRSGTGDSALEISRDMNIMKALDGCQHDIGEVEYVRLSEKLETAEGF